MALVSSRIRRTDQAFARVRDFYFASRYADRRTNPEISDFTFGNPHEMPLEGLVSALRKRAIPENKDWFAYKTSEGDACEIVAESVGKELGLAFDPADIAMTTGAFGAIMVALRLLFDAGDEAIFSEPGWFCYEPMLVAADAAAIKVPLKAPSFDLDLAAIEAAIGPKTRLVIVNTPHNPTGRIYGRAMLSELAELLDRASARFGRRIFLLSDEPYRRLRFDGREFVSPATLYPWTLITYSYGKVVLAPGQRLGYLALSPLMPVADRRAIRDVMFAAQMALGWAFPTALMQHTVPEMETLSINQSALTARRDRLMKTSCSPDLRSYVRKGPFYLWSRWPIGNPDMFWNALADRNVFVLPGTTMNTPDYFRICLTASDTMVERALPAFAAVGQLAAEPTRKAS